MPLQPRQIAKVAYEAIRAYGGTIGEPDRKHWEAAPQSDRDDVLNRVDSALRGVPYQTGIAPSDRIKAGLLKSVVDLFVSVYNPPITYAPPAPPPVEPAPIPVEVFENPDALEIVPLTGETSAGDYASNGAPVQTLDNPLADITRANAEGGETPAPATVTEALAQADANIAKENESAA